MRYSYDKEADAIYIIVSEGKYAHNVELDESRFVDYAADGTVIGVELLYVSGGVDTSGLPYASEIEQMLREHGIKIVKLGQE